MLIQNTHEKKTRVCATYARTKKGYMYLGFLP